LETGEPSQHSLVHTLDMEEHFVMCETVAEFEAPLNYIRDLKG